MNSILVVVKKILYFVFLFLLSVSMQSISRHDECDFLNKFLKSKGVHNSINQNNDINTGINLDPKDEVFSILSNCLKLDKPMISILGYSNIDKMYLLKVYVEDIQHEALTVVLLDDNCNFIDKISMEKPVNGDQLGHDNGYSIEWHYNADIVLHEDTIMTLKKSIDVKVEKNKTDTIYKEYVVGKYLCDRQKGFQMISEESIKLGNRW